jgi:uncharacterized DUF497 family protein
MLMKQIQWSPEKNHKLITEREISFEDIVFALKSGELLDDLVHPNQERYAKQRIFVVAVDRYAYLVPYMEDENSIFLNTIIPSRKATRRYLGEKHD